MDRFDFGRWLASSSTAWRTGWWRRICGRGCGGVSGGLSVPVKMDDRQVEVFEIIVQHNTEREPAKGGFAFTRCDLMR